MDIQGSPKIDKILRLPTLHKVLILIVLCAAVGGAVYAGMIKPKQAAIVTLTEELEDIEAKVVNKKRIAADIPKFKKEKEDLDIRLIAALKQLPDSREIPQLIKDINDAAKKSGLEIIYFEPKPEKAKAFYAEVPITMKVKGKYASLYGFCDKISKLSRIVNIEAIDVSVSEISGTEPILNSSFTALTFRFIPEEEQAAAKAKKKGKKK
ncbi:MAG: type 4a pilus biogenesis protein PilO [Deltaproteobacteria bacterium]|nr:type 4a pilus biogenesis protein PilO [Deltaproteobacteria bacterium]